MEARCDKIYLDRILFPYIYSSFYTQIVSWGQQALDKRHYD